MDQSSWHTILLKAALDSIPVYWLNLFSMPKSVEKAIDVLRKKFFWGSADLENAKNKLHSINWGTLCKPKQQGGLGIASLRARNMALLYKWWWRGCYDRGSFWTEFMTNKYGKGFLVNLDQISCNESSSFIFKGICEVGSKMHSKTLKDSFTWTLGNGKKILFWEDTWNNNTPLRNVFPRLCTLSRFKFVTINQFMQYWLTTKDSTFYIMMTPYHGPKMAKDSPLKTVTCS